MSKQIPYVLRTSDFLRYVNNSRLEKNIKIVLFTEKKITNAGNYLENLAMLIVLQIPFTDGYSGKQIREIPQTTTADENGILRIYRDQKIISETLESIVANCKSYNIEYSSTRVNNDDRFTVEIENYEKIFRNNLNTYRLDKTIKNLQKNKENEIEEEYVDDEDDDFLNSIIIEEEPPQVQEKENIYNFTGRKTD